MTQLYALTRKLAELQAKADTDDEGLKEALQYAMGEIRGEFSDRAESVFMQSRNNQGDINAIDIEVGRLNELKRIRKNTVGKLDEYLRNNMEAADIKTIRRPLFTITLALAPEKVIVDKEDDIPDDFIDTKTVFSPDKRAIAAKVKVIRDHS